MMIVQVSIPIGQRPGISGSFEGPVFYLLFMKTFFYISIFPSELGRQTEHYCAETKSLNIYFLVCVTHPVKSESLKDNPEG